VHACGCTSAQGQAPPALVGSLCTKGVEDVRARPRFPFTASRPRATTSTRAPPPSARLRDPVGGRKFSHDPRLSQLAHRPTAHRTARSVPSRPPDIRTQGAGRASCCFTGYPPARRCAPDPPGIGPKRQGDLHALSPQRPRDCSRSTGRVEDRVVPAEPKPDCSARCRTGIPAGRRFRRLGSGSAGARTGPMRLEPDRR